MPWEVARGALPDEAPPPLVERSIQALIDDGSLRREADGLATPDHQPRLDPQQQRARDHLLALLRDAGLTPPLRGDLPAELRDLDGLDDLLDHLERAGRIRRITADLVVHADALREATRALRASFAGRDNLTPADFRGALPDLSRKYLIPLLEYLDATGVTLRRGDRRSLREGAG